MNSTDAPPQQSKQYYESLHSQTVEPWGYNRRGAEILRHEFTAEVLKNLRPTYEAGLDIGCSQGQLTRKLAPFVTRLRAFDVSESAVRKAQDACAPAPVRFLVSRLPGLPFTKESFDLVTAADCVSEFVPDSEKDWALDEISRILKKGGIAAISDYMKPDRFAAFKELIARHFEIVQVHYLNDRLWYQFESWFKAVKNWPGIRNMLASVALAQFLRSISSAFGRWGSCHILVIARKD